MPAARHLLSSALGEWGLAAMTDDAALIISELAANAVRQGQSAPPAEVLVRISRTSRRLVIQVGDHSPAAPPRPRRAVPQDGEHGRGLQIARCLAADLAWYREDGWKLVWAAIQIPAAAGEPRRPYRTILGRAA